MNMSKWTNMFPAKLPPELLKPEPRLVGSLKVGETGFTKFTAMHVDADLDCYLKLNALLSQGNLLTMQVTRTGAGFEVEAPQKHEHTWKPSDKKGPPRIGSYASVVKVSLA